MVGVGHALDSPARGRAGGPELPCVRRVAGGAAASTFSKDERQVVKSAKGDTIELEVFGTPLMEVGNAAAFLCSDLASGITGEVLYVDAGYSHVGMAFPE